MRSLLKRVRHIAAPVLILQALPRSTHASVDQCLSLLWFSLRQRRPLLADVHRRLSRRVCLIHDELNVVVLSSSGPPWIFRRELSCPFAREFYSRCHCFLRPHFLGFLLPNAGLFYFRLNRLQSFDFSCIFLSSLLLCGSLGIQVFAELGRTCSAFSAVGE